MGNLLNRQLTPFNSEWNLDSIDELIKMGKKQLEDGQYDDALNLFQKAILLNRNDPDLWNLKGIALRSLGRYNEAIECFNKSLEIDPRDKNASWQNYKNSSDAIPK